MRAAIVTGAARGIGFGIARRLAGDGYAVGLVDVDEDGCREAVGQLARWGFSVAWTVADVSDERAVEAGVTELSRKIGPPTTLVNNAGFARDVELGSMSADDWDSVQNVHLRGSFLMCRKALPFMRAAGWGRIVNISSISSSGHADRANYCAAKAGLEGFTRALAVELGPLGVTVNSVAPGLVVTSITAATAARRGLSIEEHLNDAASRIPVGRAGQPEDIAHAVAFFASDGASFVTGQNLTVSGGVIV